MAIRRKQGAPGALVTLAAALLLCCVQTAWAGAGGVGSVGSSGGGAGPAQPACVGYSQTLRNGACSGFIGYFRGNPQCGASESVFAAEVAKAPSPSDQCCGDAQAYIRNGCNCDGQTLSLAQQNGYDTSNIPCIVRAVTKSKCNNGLSPASC